MCLQGEHDGICDKKHSNVPVLILFISLTAIFHPMAKVPGLRCCRTIWRGEVRGPGRQLREQLFRLGPFLLSFSPMHFPSSSAKSQPIKKKEVD